MAFNGGCNSPASPSRLAVVDRDGDRQPDQIGMDVVADTLLHFRQDRVSLPADPFRKVLPPTVVESSHLRQPGGLAIGDAIAELGFEVFGESFIAISTKGPAMDSGRTRPAALSCD